MILSNESSRHKSPIETLKTYGNMINPSENVTVTTTTTTVIQKKDGDNQLIGNNIRISNYGSSTPRYYHCPRAGFGPGTLPINPAFTPKAVPVPLPPSASPAPMPISPVPLPQRLSPMPRQPLPPPLMTDSLEDDNSIVVGLKVYTMKIAPTTILGKVKSFDQTKETGNVRY